MSVATWHGNVCYHPHRRSYWTGGLPGMGDLAVECADCGASASAAYQAPLPDLPPMPIENERNRTVLPFTTEGE